MRIAISALFLAASATAGAPIHAASFQANATGGNQNASIGFASDSQGGTGPVEAFVVRTDPGNAGSSASALAKAQRGSVSAVSITNSSGFRFVGNAFATASYDDVVFSWTGDGPAPAESILAGLNYNFGYNASASGMLGSINGRNYRSASYTVSFGGKTRSEEVTFDVNGNSVPSDLGAASLLANVPVGDRVAIGLAVSAGSSAVMTQLNNAVKTSMAATLNVTSMIAGSPAAPSPAGRVTAFSTLSQPLVFDLPEGYTANSASMGIVDNVWIYAPVPEPATVSSMLGGLLIMGLVAHRRRSRRCEREHP